MLGFRYAQCVSDLLLIASSNDRLFQDNSAAEELRTELHKAVLTAGQGSNVAWQGFHALWPQLQSLASAPECDRDDFGSATAWLLAAHLAGAPGPQKLSALWRAHRVAYFTLGRHVRATIIQGYLQAEQSGLLTLRRPLPSAAHLTRCAETVDRDLGGMIRQGATRLVDALQSTGSNAGPMVPDPGLLLAALQSDAPLGSQATRDLVALVTPIALESTNRANRPATAFLMRNAVNTGDQDAIIRRHLWPVLSGTWTAAVKPYAPVLKGVRYLYESVPDWRPDPDHAERTLPLI